MPVILTIKLKFYFIIFATFVISNTVFCQKNLDDLNFLIGTWKVEGKQTYEYWEKINDLQFNGVSYKNVDGNKIITELLSIKISNKKIIYKATVLDQNNGETISFTQNTSIKKLFSFENLDHDFPKKIQYQKLTKNKIQVHVLGNEESDFTIILLKQ